MENTCLFCRIAKKEIPAKIIYESGDILAFEDIDPKAPFHCLIIPKQHIVSLADAKSGDKDILGSLLLAARDIAEKEKLDKSGYRVVNNIGQDGGQSVFHIHFHLLGGRQLSWPPG